MTADALPSDTPQAASRRATDTMPLKFKGAVLKASAFPEHLPADHEFEVINIDAVLPHGSHHDFKSGAASPASSRTSLTPEERAHQLQLIAFKRYFAEFAFTEGLSRIDIGDLKRGDVVVIKTIVGGIYFRIVDRIKGLRSRAGQILCECYYELGDPANITHTASIELPVCTNRHVIQGADGSKRLASRKLKMTTAAELSAKLDTLLDERFIVDIGIYSNPQPEKLRVVDGARWLARMAMQMGQGIAWVFGKIKALIDENNRHEEEKKQRQAERNQAKQAEREVRK